MNASSHSEWSNSSGCESGWTMYLEQSSSFTSQKNHFGNYNNRTRIIKDNQAGEEEEEDLSMVSDASSGPIHYCEEANYCFDLQYSSMNDMRIYNKKKINQQQFSCLDDTASSSVSNKKYSKSVNPSENVFDFSPSSSNTHLKGKSKLKNLGLLESSGKSASKAGGFLGRRQK